MCVPRKIRFFFSKFGRLFQSRQPSKTLSGGSVATRNSYNLCAHQSLLECNVRRRRQSAKAHCSLKCCAAAADSNWTETTRCKLVGAPNPHTKSPSCLQVSEATGNGGATRGSCECVCLCTFLAAVNKALSLTERRPSSLANNQLRLELDFLGSGAALEHLSRARARLSTSSSSLSLSALRRRQR